jgi:Sulfate permease family
VGRTFASLKNYQVDGNKEMMAIGIMNMAGSCASCYVTTGIFLNYISYCTYTIELNLYINSPLQLALQAFELLKITKILDFLEIIFYHCSRLI